MNETLTFVAIGLGLLALLLWLPLGWSRQRREVTEAPGLKLEDLTPRHALYISHIQNALSAIDLDYLESRVSAKTLRRVRMERRRVARQFLAGLGDDYRRLDKLARVVAALSPKVEYKQEFGRLWLGLRFRALYVLVWVRLSLGPAPLAPFVHLAGIVGSLSARLEAAMNALAERSVARAGVGV
jgi:hypothetical protein